MINLFGEEYADVPHKKRKPIDPKIKAWEDGFQKWSNKEFVYDDTYHYGKCGHGAICDYCDGDNRGRMCVRALNCMCREKFLTIDYSDRSIANYERWFDGG